MYQAISFNGYREIFLMTVLFSLFFEFVLWDSVCSCEPDCNNISAEIVMKWITEEWEITIRVCIRPRIVEVGCRKNS